MVWPTAPPPHAPRNSPPPPLLAQVVPCAHHLLLPRPLRCSGRPQPQAPRAARMGGVLREPLHGAVLTRHAPAQGESWLWGRSGTTREALVWDTSRHQLMSREPCSVCVGSCTPTSSAPPLPAAVARLPMCILTAPAAAVRPHPHTFLSAHTQTQMHTAWRPHHCHCHGPTPVCCHPSAPCAGCTAL